MKNKIYLKIFLSFVLAFVLFISHQSSNIALATTITWDGGGGDNNWSTCANWDNSNTCPGASDAVVFNGTSTKASTIDAGFAGTIGSLSINTGYTGIITQSRSLSTGSYSQAVGTFTGGSSSLTDSGAFALSGGTFTAPSGTLHVAGNFSITGGTFTANGGTVDFNGTTLATLNCNNITFNLVTFTNTTNQKTANPSCSMPLGNNPTITGPVELFDGTFSGSGTLTASADFTFLHNPTLSGFTAMTVNANLYFGGNAGNTGFTLGSLSTLTVNGNLVVEGNANLSLSAVSTVDINGNLLIDNPPDFVSSNVLTAPTGTLSVSGNFNLYTSGGSRFVANGGTVVLDGSNQQLSVDGNNTIKFYNLTKTTSSTDTLTLTANSTYEIDGTMNLQGAASNLLTLKSSSPGVKWKISPRTANRTVNYLAVSDSNNIIPLQIEVTGHNITNSGGNIGWNFAGSAILSTLELYTVSPFTDKLYTVNANLTTTDSTTSITLTGKTVTGTNGLAYDPTTCTLYSMLTLNGQSGRQLVTINPLTGVATSIGNTGKKFSGIAFDSSGILYGVTGDGESNLPETLYTLNLSTGTPTLFLALGNGDNGEAIAYNSSDGLMYHQSGSTTQVFEKINLSTLSNTNIPVSGDSYNETAGLLYIPERSYFFAGDTGSTITTFTSAGVASTYGYTFDNSFKGMVNTSCSVPTPTPTATAAPTSAPSSSGGSSSSSSTSSPAPTAGPTPTAIPFRGTAEESPVPQSTIEPTNGAQSTEPEAFSNKVTEVISSSAILQSISSALSSVAEVAKKQAPIIHNIITPVILIGLIPLANIGTALVSLGNIDLSWSLIASILRSLGILPKLIPQGVVYDSFTFAPVPFAALTVSDNEDTVIDTMVTDVGGVYGGIKLSQGNYKITVKHHEYRFPTSKPRPVVFALQDFYKGEQFFVSNQNKSQFFIIPVDEAVKVIKENRTKIITRVTRILSVFSKLSSLFFYPLLILSAILFFADASVVNGIFLEIYTLVAIKRLTTNISFPTLVGVVEDEKGQVVPDAIVRLAELDGGKTVEVTRSDANGNYKFFSQPNVYRISTQKLGYANLNQGMTIQEVNTKNDKSFNVTLSKNPYIFT